MPVIISETIFPSFVTIVNEKTKSPSAVTFISEIADRCRWHGERRLGRGTAVAEIDSGSQKVQRECENLYFHTLVTQQLK